MAALGNIHLTPELVQAVRDAADIVDIASEHTRLAKAGRRYKGLCPLHKEKTPSFSVDADQGLYYCFGCGQGGDAIKLHMLTSGDDFPAAIEALARRYGIALPSAPTGGARRRQDVDEIERALEAAEKFFRRQLESSRKPQTYLEGRRIPGELIETYRVGYAPADWRQLITALEPELGVARLEKAGLVARSERHPDKPPYDRFRDRLMFPIRNASGRLVGFGGRTLGDDRAKYINTNETPRFRKGEILYGLDVAKRRLRETRRALLVEGYFDALGAAAAGLDGVVASMGTALTPAQAKLLARFSDEVVVGYDADEAGEAAYRRALPLLLADGLAVSRPRFDSGHDPDSIRLEHGDEQLVGLVEQAHDAVLVEISRVTPPGVGRDPRGQARAARAVVALLEPIPDAVLRFGYARRAAERLGVPVELLTQRLGGAGGSKGQHKGRPREASPVRSLEEKTLQLLLAGGEPLPPPSDLPPAEAFFDTSCRNIYEAFTALYEGGQARVPPPREVLARLPERGGEVDQVARLLLEGSATPGAGELEGCLQSLTRRWRQRRQRELASLIGEAERSGNQEQLQQLLDEKAVLSRLLHGKRPHV